MNASQAQKTSGFHQTVMSPLSRRGKMAVGLRMTPMIDVIFLLLTFFVLTAKFQDPEQLLPVFVGNPDTQTSIVDPKTLAIYVETISDGALIRVANRPAILLSNTNPQDGLLALARKVGQVSESTPLGSIELFYDDQVTWDIVVKVYDVLYALGARDITFRIEE